MNKSQTLHSEMLDASFAAEQNGIGADQLAPRFVERRIQAAQRKSPGIERRQFSNSHTELSPEAAELGRAIDEYKLANRRRFLNYEEMLSVVKSLGYHRGQSG